jgi:antitoxin ParD1/3/4
LIEGMNVSLTPELEKWVHHKVQSGLYGSSSEVVRDALRVLHQYEEERIRKFSSLQTEIQIGLEQLNAGRFKKMDDSLIEGIKERGRKRFNG